MKKFFLKHKIISSIIITAIQFLAVFFVISYIFNSDEYLAELSLSGDYYGECAEQYPFINAVLARFLILLYRLFGTVPWYSLMDIVFLFVSFSAIHYSLLTVLLPKKLSLFVIEALYSVVFCIVLLPNLSAITFTLVAVCPAIAGFCLLFTEIANLELE